MNRWRAAGTHFSISLIVAAIILGLMLWLWYPPPYFKAMGGTTLALLIAGCDVVIGPLITLIIYAPLKKGLKLDLTIIAALQLCALAYGTYTMFITRPVFTLFVVDRFEVVAANDIKQEELDKGSREEFRSLSITGPVLAAAALPEDPMERRALLMEALKGGDDAKNLPRLFVRYEDAAQQVAQKAKPLTKLLSRPGESASQLISYIEKEGKKREELGYLPLSARTQDMSAIVDISTGRLLKIVELSPW